MLIDYTNDDIRNELLNEFRPMIIDHVRQQLTDLDDPSLVDHEYTKALREIVRYLDDHLIIQFKD